MSGIKAQDPFRFLKRIKRDLSPAKDRDSTGKSQFNDVKKRASDILTNKHQCDSIDQSNIYRIQQHSFRQPASYDPNKYYSNKCLHFLQNIHFAHPQTYTKSEVGMSEGQKEKRGEGQRGITHQLTTESKNSKYNTRQLNDALNEITFKKIDFETVQGNGLFDRQNQIQVQFFQQEQQLPNEPSKQLKQCNICGRNFNVNSYQKHSSVCESVFMRKRKVFSSQKQRSQSKDKKKP